MQNWNESINHYFSYNREKQEVSMKRIIGIVAAALAVKFILGLIGIHIL